MTRPAGAARGDVLWLVPLVVLLLGLGACQGWERPSGASPTVTSGSARTPRSGLPTIAETDLPAAAHDVLATVRSGGPFRYAEDGGVFANRERLLPARPQGYYREYTVRKPGEQDRGPWRIVAGQDGDLYWTRDHYASFEQIEESP